MILSISEILALARSIFVSTSFIRFYIEYRTSPHPEVSLFTEIFLFFLHSDLIPEGGRGEEFVRDYVFPMLRANAIYESFYLLGTSIARPVIAKKQVEVAHKVGADALSHGATGKGNDQVRFELAYMALDPKLKIISPWREWEFKGRSELIEYAKKRGIPVPVTKEKPYSIDRNLLHVSYEGGILEDPWKEPPEDMFLMTVSPEKAPDRPTYIEIEFQEGNPVAVDGKRMSPASLLSYLNQIGGKNGIGRVDVVENRYVGIKSRGVYETPGGTILRIAHMAIESITLDREVMHIRDSLIPKSEMFKNMSSGYGFLKFKLHSSDVILIPL